MKTPFFCSFIIFYFDCSAMSNGSESEGPILLKRKNYDLEFKLKAVEYVEKHRKKKSGEEFQSGHKSDVSIDFET